MKATGITEGLIAHVCFYEVVLGVCHVRSRQLSGWSAWVCSMPASWMTG